MIALACRTCGHSAVDVETYSVAGPILSLFGGPTEEVATCVACGAEGAPDEIADEITIDDAVLSGDRG